MIRTAFNDCVSNPVSTHTTLYDESDDLFPA